MPEPYAEVIGDPVDHSLSPLIHRFWLRGAAIDADYRATRVKAEELETFLSARRADPLWRGCNVTAPLKRLVTGFLDGLSANAEQSGAVNCVVRNGGRLIGHNADVDGVAAALAGAEIARRKAAVIGCGGAAAAAVLHLTKAGAGEIVLLVRDPEKAEAVRRLAPARIRAVPIDDAAAALDGASVVINATPLGMAHAGPMPAAVLDAVGSAAPGATVLDMVYRSLRTPLLQEAGRAGLRAADGLTMLVAQARAAFELFYGRLPPGGTDQELRRELVAAAAG